MVALNLDQGECEQLRRSPSAIPRWAARWPLASETRALPAQPPPSTWSLLHHTWPNRRRRPLPRRRPPSPFPVTTTASPPPEASLPPAGDDGGGGGIGAIADGVVGGVAAVALISVAVWNYAKL